MTCLFFIDTWSEEGGKKEEEAPINFIIVIHRPRGSQQAVALQPTKCSTRVSIKPIIPTLLYVVIQQLKRRSSAILSVSVWSLLSQDLAPSLLNKSVFHNHFLPDLSSPKVPSLYSKYLNNTVIWKAQGYPWSDVDTKEGASNKHSASLEYFHCTFLLFGSVLERAHFLGSVIFSPRVSVQKDV